MCFTMTDGVVHIQKNAGRVCVVQEADEFKPLNVIGAVAGMVARGREPAYGYDSTMPYASAKFDARSSLWQSAASVCHSSTLVPECFIFSVASEDITRIPVIDSQGEPTTSSL